MLACPRCMTALPPGALVCTSCGALVHGARLEQLANEAYALEATSPHRAAMVWRQALDLLPRDAQQYASIYQRMHALAAGMAAPDATPHNAVPYPGQELQYEPREPVRNDPWPLAVAKTLGSMLLSIVVYYFVFGQNWIAAVGFTVLILVHEMGHVVALWRYGLSASPPIFIPFMGALINLRQPPRDAWEEAVVGIGGPVAGTIGALACWAAFYQTGWLPLIPIAYWGVILNGFNMLPVPPLDGGRITAAVSPWVWIPGVLGLVGLFVYEFLQTGRVSFIMLLILFYALPRIRQTLSNRQARQHPYYRIGRRWKWLMGAFYLGLSAVLLASYVYLSHVLLA